MGASAIALPEDQAMTILRMIPETEADGLQAALLSPLPSSSTGRV